MRSEICTKCKIRKRIYNNHARCKVCYAEDQREQRIKHGDLRRRSDRERRRHETLTGKRRDAKNVKEKREKLNEYKLQQGCMDCGYDLHPFALQFDHVRGTKSYNLGNSVSRSWERTLQEIAKCEVVCANCHMIRTYGGTNDDKLKETTVVSQRTDATPA